MPLVARNGRSVIGRREILALCGAPSSVLFAATGSKLPQIRIAVHVMYDAAAHSGRGLRADEIALFRGYQEIARRDFAVSGIVFDLSFVQGAYLRTLRGFPEIPDRFLLRKNINVFVMDALPYDLDRDRTGGSSMGPHAPVPRLGGDPFYKTFLGLRDAGRNTLEHEYAHHFTLDTTRNPTMMGNLRADLRNDWWLWLQRRGFAIEGFRACARAEFATLEGK